MDEAETHQPVSLASLCMKIVIMFNLDENLLVEPLKNRTQDIKSLHGKYRVKGIVLEVKRHDKMEPTDQDWKMGNNDKPPVKTGSVVLLTLEPRISHFEALTTMVLGNFRTTFDADDDLSHVRNGRKELRFIQEFFYNSSIQTTEWEKTVSMKKFAKIHQQIPWKFKKESFTRKGNDLFWRIERKNGRIYSSWICVCTRYVEQPLAL